MSYRQKFYIGLAVSAGLCTSIGIYIYLRYRRQISVRKALNADDHSSTTSSLLASISPRRGDQYTEITSLDEINDQKSNSIQFQSANANVEINFSDQNMILTEEQAIILTRYLDENSDEKLNRTLTTIANLGICVENQNHLANAGCIERLFHILQSNENELVIGKVLLALNNLALNQNTISRFSEFVSHIIRQCRLTPSKSLVRLYALNLLVNISVQENLHGEFIKNMPELNALIDSSWQNQDEALSVGKLLVNLSTNKDNVEPLFKLTGIDLKTIVSYCTPSKRSTDSEEPSKLEDILLRFLTFYCNLSESIVQQLENDENSQLVKSWITDPVPHGQGALYFELFDHSKQMLSKTILRPQYSSATMNRSIGRFRRALEEIRRIQFESTVSNTQNEFDENEPPLIPEASTPKRLPENNSNDIIQEIGSLDDLEKEINGQFDDDDETILAGGSPSDQSLSSFRSALSTNDNNICHSP